MEHGELASTFADVLLIPTRIYCDPLVRMLQSVKKEVGFDRNDIHGLCHITGGGLSNLLRLHDSFGWIIDQPLPIHPEFTWLQERGNVTDWEMYRTFNMGMGMVLVVSKTAAVRIVDWLKLQGTDAQIVGRVSQEGTYVLHTSTQSKYDAY